jgi:hypothetical protein
VLNFATSSSADASRQEHASFGALAYRVFSRPDQGCLRIPSPVCASPPHFANQPKRSANSQAPRFITRIFSLQKDVLGHNCSPCLASSVRFQDDRCGMDHLNFSPDPRYLDVFWNTSPRSNSRDWQICPSDTDKCPCECAF